jgi:hypothetical protein
MSDNKMTLFELKEKAKWSSDPEEKKAAIKELSTYGENAISELQEIMNITAYEDIKNACAEAIKSMRRQQHEARNNAKVNETSSSTIATTNSSSNSAPDAVVTQDKKKEKFKKEEGERKEAEKHMRDFNQASWPAT